MMLQTLERKDASRFPDWTCDFSFVCQIKVPSGQLEYAIWGGM